MINLMCCVEGRGVLFSKIALFIAAKTKYRGSHHLNVSWLYLQNHIRTSLGRPHHVSQGCSQDVSRTLSLELNIRPYEDILIMYAEDKTSHGVQYLNVFRMLHWDVLRRSYFNPLRTSVGDVLKTSVGDISWRYIEDQMWTSIGRLWTSSWRLRDVILPSE